MTQQRWVNAALRSIIWLGFAALWASLTSPDGASLLTVRSGAAGWLGAVLLVAGLALHLWSNVSLARREASAWEAPTGLVAQGPYRYVRNPIYLAGAPIFLGIYLLHSQWRRADIVGASVVAIVFQVLVVRVEEPALRKRLGAAYDEYCRRVPRWIPRAAKDPRGGA